MSMPTRADGETDEDFAERLTARQARLAEHSLRSPAGHYTGPDGEEYEGLPEPPEGHLWTRHDVWRMGNGQSPTYPDPATPSVFVNPPHDVDTGRKPSNVVAGTAHFPIRLDDGARRCGGCTEEWPCAASQQLDWTTGEQVAALPQGGAHEAAARLLGISPDELARKLAAGE